MSSLCESSFGALGLQLCFLEGKDFFFIALRISKGKPDPVFFFGGKWWSTTCKV